MPKTRPNFLFIMADQMAAPALPFYGHPVVQAPHLAGLASDGVVFENAYCNSPLCAPSRASMMTGQLPSRIGAYDNAASFSPEVPTLAHYLRALGYQTCLAGKMHFIGPDQLHGFEERLTTDIYPADFGWTPDWGDFEARPSWYHNMLSVVQAGVCQASNQLDFDEEVAFQAERKIYDLARADDERPFLLLVSFTHPHDPFAITPAYWDRYEGAEIDLPAVPPLSPDEMDPHSRRLHHVCDLAAYRQTDERVRRARRAYYGMISYIDDKVGRLVAALEATEQRDSTVIVFVSDHGEMLGERGLWYKMCFFEWSARVPMVIHGPDRFAPRRVRTPVSLVDLLPTLVDLAAAGGSPDAAPIDGASLVPYLRGADEDERRPVYGEMLAEGTVAPLLMVRRGRHKYVYCETDPEQLFDLAADPHERHNLAGRTACEPDRAAMHETLRARWDPTQLRRAVVASQQRRRAVDAALRQGRFAPWDFQPHQDASSKYMRNHLDLDALEKRARYPAPDTAEEDGGR